MGNGWEVEEAIQPLGCDPLDGLLSPHLQRIEPDESHRQAGLVRGRLRIEQLWDAPAP